MASCRCNHCARHTKMMSASDGRMLLQLIALQRYKIFRRFPNFSAKICCFFAWYIYGTCYGICLKNIYHAAKPLCIEVSAHLWYMGTCFSEFLWKQLMACQLLICIFMRILHINPLSHPFYRLAPPSHPFGGAKWVT